MDPVCRIRADAFERDSRVIEALEAIGVAVEVVRFDVGDYDLGEGVLVERKSVPDLHLSVERGRLWRQIGDLRRVARLPYLLIEGADLDNGSLAPNAIRGVCLAVMGQGIAIIRSRDALDSARWLHLLALRPTGARLRRDRPVYAQRLKPPREQVPEAMLAAVPTLSVAMARRLLERFGSVAGIVSAGRDEWLAVPGIGRERAALLERGLHERYAPPA